MIERIKDKLRKQLAQEIQCTKEIIAVSPHRGVFNSRCYDNAVEFASHNPDHKVIETIYIVDHYYPILHYVNQTPDGEYLETSLLVYQAECYEYYYLRLIHPCNYKTIGLLFNNTHDYWSNKYLQRWHKLIGIDSLL